MKMHKYNAQYENQIFLMAQNKVESGNYKVFDSDARVITKRKFPDLVEQGVTYHEECLIIANRTGETIVITREFGRILYNALKAENL